MELDHKIAVTVIGGYLGAGKTTLVNHVLRTADERVAVLVNDFGDVNIDADLIKRQDGDTIELANGCICCSLVDGLAAAMSTISELPEQPERLVIEASGVADPKTIAAYGHGPGFVLDAVVVVVDAETVRSRSRDKYVGDTVMSQLQSGDIILLNKLDLLDDAAAADVRSWLTDVVPTAVVVDTINAEAGPEILFGQVPDPKVQPARAPAGESLENDGHDHAKHEHSGSGHQHDQIFESWSWTGTEPIPRQRIETLMDALPDTIVRAKGLVVVDDRTDKIMLLQRVGKRWTLLPRGPMPPDPHTRLVFIGMTGAIDDQWLVQHLS